MNYAKYLWMVLFMAVIIVGCEKDDDLINHSNEQQEDLFDSNLSVMAKLAFDKKLEIGQQAFSGKEPEFPCSLDLTPDWDKSRSTIYKGEPILLVPIESSIKDFGPFGSESRWIFWDEGGEAQFNLIVTQAKPDFALTNQVWDVNAFDGIISVFDANGYIGHSIYKSPEISFDIAVDRGDIESRGGNTTGCYDFGNGGSFWSRLWKGIKSVFSAIGNFLGSGGGIVDRSEWIKDSGFTIGTEIYNGSGIVYDPRGRGRGSNDQPDTAWELLPDGFFFRFLRLTHLDNLFEDNCADNENSFINYLYQIDIDQALDFMTHTLVESVLNGVPPPYIGAIDQANYSQDYFNLIDEEIRFILTPILLGQMYAATESGCNLSIMEVLNNLSDLIPDHILRVIAVQRNCVVAGGAEFMIEVNELRSISGEMSTSVDRALIQLFSDGNCGSLEAFNEHIVTQMINRINEDLDLSDAQSLHLSSNVNLMWRLVSFLDQHRDEDGVVDPIALNFAFNHVNAGVSGEAAIFIEDIPYFGDENGVLHFYLEPIDLNTATSQEKVDQILEALRLSQKYYCDYDFYEALDWADYMLNINFVQGVFVNNIMWQNILFGSGEVHRVTIDLSFHWRNNTIMNYSPVANIDNEGKYGWRYKHADSEPWVPMMDLSTVTSDGGTTIIEDNAVNINCE